MTEYAIVDLETAEVVPQKGQAALTFRRLDRVRYPEGSTADSVQPGHEIPPQYGEDGEPPPAFRLYEVMIVDVGSGPVIADTGAPVFDPVADTVTVTRTLEAAPPPPDPATTDLTAEDNERLWRAQGVTAAQITAAKRDRGKPMP